MSALSPSRTLLIALTALAPLACQKPAVAPIAPGPGDPGVEKPDSEAINKELSKVLEKGSSEELVRFGSTRELGKYIKALQRQNRRRDKKSGAAFGGMPAATDGSAAPPAEESKAEGEASEDDSITNTQEQGVDEGGIVKAHGDHLVVLRRGRLFTVKVGDQALKPVSMIDVSPTQGHNAWYDEMLIRDNTIVVVGFSYQVGATELGLFRIDARGQLSRKDTFFLRSNDYYSSRNYASRLLGDKLVFYMPHFMGWGWNDNQPNLPAVAHWDGSRRRADDFDLIIEGNDIFRPIQPVQNPVLHTVVTCDLSRGNFKCDAQGIVGPAGRSFYVSKNAVYVWVHEGWGAQREGEEASPAAVYRLPLNKRQQMGALHVWGAPVDQFSFKESSDGHLNVLVRADAKGDAMWSPEFANGDIGMLRVPVQAFNNGVSTVSADAFVDLPEPEQTGYYAFQNRFVGDFLLYGAGSGWGHAADESRGTIFAHPFASGLDGANSIPIPHGADRIEALGGDAVVIGSSGRNLHVTALELSDRPSVAGAFVRRRASQGELRSHGFFYKPSGEDTGTLGLPIRRMSEPGAAHLVHGSAEILFLDVDALNLRELGALASDPRAGTDDRCVTSCVDWYGNARPIFYKGRVFALLGYELVEGDISRGGIREVRRTNMLRLIRGSRKPIWKKG